MDSNENSRRMNNGFIEEDIPPDQEIDIENLPVVLVEQSNKENVPNNVAEKNRMREILANIGPDDEVKLLSHFFKVVEKNEKHITADCLGCGHKYKAQPNVHSNFVTHLKVSSFWFSIFTILFIDKFI